MDLLKEIDSYIEALKEIHRSINELEGDRFIESHKKTLLFSLLETMGKGTYGHVFRQNNQRFERFILEFCDWEHADMVSIQQLELVLQDTVEDEFKGLKSFVNEKLANYPMSQAVPFRYDVKLEEVKAKMPRGFDNVNRVNLESLKHVSLLWKMRNGLVHEARAMDSMGLFDFVEFPHYVSYMYLDKEEEYEVWRISYPITFFNNLIETAFRNMRDYLIEEEINPKGNYDFGDLWVRPRGRF